MNYAAPLNELRFGLQVNGRLDEILQLPACAGLGADTVDAVLEEAARFAEQEWAPTNRTGDKHGAGFSDGIVCTHPDLVQAYQSFCEAGWAGLRAPAEFDGQGLPHAVSAACEEMWCAANLSLSLMPMLTLGAVDAIAKHGSEAQKQTYLPKMCQGLWSGTMVLSEPEAGSDLNDLRTMAMPSETEGVYRISGQKIFITWGDQDITENIVHLVLARLPDAAPGVQGISMFIVPKFLITSDGGIGARNGVETVGIEHKLGIHASPTCTLQFNDAEGYLVGRAGKGLAYMFTMMKTARLNVGIEGHAVAERACQNALAYAQQRIQGSEEGRPVPIIRHADVRRMLLVQQATLAAQRGLYLRAAALADFSDGLEDNVARKQPERELDFLIPIVKAWLTDNSTVLTNLAIQVYGGAGFIEESGVAQYMRDARITPIYEGTNGIQAADAAGRKTTGKNGALPLGLLAEGKRLAAQLADSELADNLLEAIESAENSIAHLVQHADHPSANAASAHAYLQQMGLTLGAIESARAFIAAQAALDGEADNRFGTAFYLRQQNLTRVYFAEVLPHIHTCAAQIRQTHKWAEITPE